MAALAAGLNVPKMCLTWPQIVGKSTLRLPFLSFFLHFKQSFLPSFQAILSLLIESLMIPRLRSSLNCDECGAAILRFWGRDDFLF